MAKSRKPDRRIRRTRRQLFRALHQLINEIPYDQISVSKIVDTADISRATFYLHYNDKHELLIASLETLFAEVIQKFQDQPPSNTLVSDINSLVLAIFQNIYDNQSFYLALQQNGIALFPMMNGLVDVVQNRIHDAMPADHDTQMNIDSVAHQMVGSLYALILWWLAHDMTESPADMAQRYDDFVGESLQHSLVILKTPH